MHSTKTLRLKCIKKEKRKRTNRKSRQAHTEGGMDIWIEGENEAQ